MQPSSATKGQGYDVVSAKAWREFGDRPAFLWLLASKVAKTAQGKEHVSGGVVFVVASGDVCNEAHQPKDVSPHDILGQMDGECAVYVLLLCRLAADHLVLPAQAWSQGDLACTPAKHAEFLTYNFEEALASTTLADPWRYYQNTTSSVTSKLLDKHGYADDGYKPMKSEPHRTRGKQLLLLQKDRLGW